MFSLRSLVRNTDGAVAVDWMIVTASLVGLGAATTLTLSDGTVDLAGDISAALSNTKVEIVDPAYATQPGSNISGIEFASYFGADDGNGGLINIDTANGLIAGKSALTNTELLQDYANNYLVNRPTLATQMLTEIEHALLQERGYDDPALAAPLVNLSPTNLTVADFTELTQARPPLATEQEVADFLAAFDAMHTVHLTDYFDKTKLSDAEYFVAVAVLQERGAL